MDQVHYQKNEQLPKSFKRKTKRGQRIEFEAKKVGLFNPTCNNVQTVVYIMNYLFFLND